MARRIALIRHRHSYQSTHSRLTESLVSAHLCAGQVNSLTSFKTNGNTTSIYIDCDVGVCNP